MKEFNLKLKLRKGTKINGNHCVQYLGLRGEFISGSLREIIIGNFKFIHRHLGTWATTSGNPRFLQGRRNIKQNLAQGKTDRSRSEGRLKRYPRGWVRSPISLNSSSITNNRTTDRNEHINNKQYLLTHSQSQHE